MTENPRVGGSIPSLATNKIKNLGSPRRHRAWNKTRQVEYSPTRGSSFLETHRSSIVEYEPRRGIFSHSRAYFSARSRTPRLPHVNHLRRLPVAVSEPIVCGFEVVLVCRVLCPKVIERERFLQYRFERDNSVLAPATLQSSLDETVPIAPKSAAGEGVTLKITDQGRTDIGAELMRAFDDFAQLGRPFDNYDLRGLYDLSVTRMAALGLGRSKYQPVIRVNLWIAIRERQQVIFALTCNRR